MRVGVASSLYASFETLHGFMEQLICAFERTIHLNMQFSWVQSVKIRDLR